MKPSSKHPSPKAQAGAPVVVKIHYAKTNLSRLIARVLRGERVVIARDMVPVVELVRVREPDATVSRARRFGALRGVVAVTPAFFQALPQDELAGWDA